MTSTTRSRSRSRSRRLLALAAVPLLVGGLAACSDTGTDDSGSEAGVEQRAHDWDLALAQCVRDAGFDMDDPTGGGLSVAVPDGADQEAYFSALDDCSDSVTAERGDRPVSEKEKKASEEAAAEWARVEDCLEEHGVELPEAESGITEAPAIPDDIAAECGADHFSMPTDG